MIGKFWVSLMLNVMKVCFLAIQLTTRLRVYNMQNKHIIESINIVFYENVDFAGKSNNDESESYIVPT